MAAPPALPELFYRAGAKGNYVLAGGPVMINLGRNTRNWTLPIRRAPYTSACLRLPLAKAWGRLE